MHYNSYRPSFLNNSYSNNTAPYGSNIASYPVKIVVKDQDDHTLSLYDIASGQVITPNLVLNQIDYDNQTIATDSSSIIRFSVLEDTTDIDGTREAVVTNGTATFTDLMLVAKPGTQNTTFSITSDSIDTEILALQYGSNLPQQQFVVYFRL